MNLDYACESPGRGMKSGRHHARKAAQSKSLTPMYTEQIIQLKIHSPMANSLLNQNHGHIMLSSLNVSAGKVLNMPPNIVPRKTLTEIVTISGPKITERASSARRLNFQPYIIQNRKAATWRVLLTSALSKMVCGEGERKLTQGITDCIQRSGRLDGLVASHNNHYMGGRGIGASDCIETQRGNFVCRDGGRARGMGGSGRQGSGRGSFRAGAWGMRLGRRAGE